MEFKQDKRVERTRQAILNAFTEMIIETEFSKITVKGLAEKAGINRKTFYLHYTSMEDILFDLTIELSEKVYESLQEKKFFDNQELNKEVLVVVIEDLITNNRELIRKLVSADSYHSFARNVKDMLKDSFIRKLKSRIDLSPYMLNLIGDYIGVGISKVLKDWFEDPGGLSTHDIANVASTLIYSGVQGLNKFDWSSIQKDN